MTTSNLAGDAVRRTPRSWVGLCGQESGTAALPRRRAEQQLSPARFLERHSSLAAFTMVEIALCLAIIGFALVALIGIMPAALNVQKENRQETVINNDAVLWLDALRGGANYFPIPGAERNVFALTNWTTEYDPATLAITRPTYPRGLDITSISPNLLPQYLMGLLRTPRTYVQGNTLYSNHVVAYVNAFTAPAVNLAPQDNTNILKDAFSYTLTVDITEHRQPPELVNTNYVRTLAQNLRDLQLTFGYPLLHNGRDPKWSLVYRSTLSGDLRPEALPFQAPPVVGGWSAELWNFRPGTYVRPQP